MGATFSRKDKGGAVSDSVHEWPEDILLSVLSHFPGEQLIHCRRVCKFWRNLIDTKTLWWTKYERELAQQGIPRGEDLDILSLQMICIKQPFNRNLLKNWNAEEGMEHWHVHSNGGDGFRVESPIYADPLSTVISDGVKKCWATSYDECIKSQMVDLMKAGCPERLLRASRVGVYAREWTAARFDCGSQYRGSVRLLDECSKIIVEEDKERTVGQWQDQSWEKMEWHFPDPKVKAGHFLAFVVLTHGGSDTQFWAGYYGPKMAAPSVMAMFKPCNTGS